jgi:hypothetical protein
LHSFINCYPPGTYWLRPFIFFPIRRLTSSGDRRKYPAFRAVKHWRALVFPIRLNSRAGIRESGVADWTSI